MEYSYICNPVAPENASGTNGEMLEWFKRHAWKACKLLKGFTSSNLVLSAGKTNESLTENAVLLRGILRFLVLRWSNNNLWCGRPKAG